MTIDIRTGWEKHGVPVGKRNFRDAKKGIEYTPMNAVVIFPLFLLAVLYGLFLDIKDALDRLFWKKPLSLKRKVCLVTGSGRGIGRQICLDLAEKGAKLACADINEETNRITLKMLAEIDATAKGYKLNVADRDEVLKVIKKVEEDLGPIYLVVNGAVILLPPSEVTEEYTRATFNVNILGPIWITEAVLPKLEERNSGHIVNICSISSFFPPPAGKMYCATKAALRSYTLSTNVELKRKGSNVRITCVCPSPTNSSADYTEMLFQSRLNTLPIRMVSEAVVEAVTLGIDDITVPPSAKLLFLAFQFMPAKAVAFFFSKARVKVIMPTKEEYEMLPAGDLVRKCSRIGDVKEPKNENKPTTE